MNTNKILLAIETALIELDSLVAKSKYYADDKEPVICTRNVLNLLKMEMQRDPNHINERILRAMHDVGMSAYKDFENTSLEDAIGNVTGLLYNEISHYKRLEPLRMDFGKGDPI